MYQYFVISAKYFNISNFSVEKIVLHYMASGHGLTKILDLPNLYSMPKNALFFVKKLLSWLHPLGTMLFILSCYYKFFQPSLPLQLMHSIIIVIYRSNNSPSHIFAPVFHVKTQSIYWCLQNLKVFPPPYFLWLCSWSCSLVIISIFQFRQVSATFNTDFI